MLAFDKFNQFYNDLDRYIDSKNYNYGDFIPSERQLSNDFFVSRNTVRKVIKKMIQLNKLQSIHGKGTYIAHPKINIDMKEMISFTEAYNKQGLIITNKLLNFTIIFADTLLANKLDINIDDEVYKLSRVRYINDVPFSIEVSNIPVKYCPNLIQFDFETNSLYKVLSTNYDLTIKKQHINVNISKAKTTEAKYLYLSYNDPIFVEKAIAYDVNNVPIEYTKAIVNIENSQYTVTLNN